MGFWLMKLYGHADVRILDYPRQSWQQDGRPWTSRRGRAGVVGLPAPGTRRAVRVPTSASVDQAIDDPSRTIVDVRSAAEFRGERFWPSGGLEEGGRAGHVPTAVHNPIEGLHRRRRTRSGPRRSFASCSRRSTSTGTAS